MTSCVQACATRARMLLYTCTNERRRQFPPAPHKKYIYIKNCKKQRPPKKVGSRHVYHNLILRRRSWVACQWRPWRDLIYHRRVKPGCVGAEHPAQWVSGHERLTPPQSSSLATWRLSGTDVDGWYLFSPLSPPFNCSLEKLGLHGGFVGFLLTTLPSSHESAPKGFSFSFFFNVLGGLFVALLISVALSLSYSFPDSLPLSLAVVMSVCVRERQHEKLQNCCCRRGLHWCAFDVVGGGLSVKEL